MWTYTLRLPEGDFVFDVDFSTGETSDKLEERHLLELRRRSLFQAHVWLKIVMANVDDPRKMSTGLRMRILAQLEACTDEEVSETTKEWLDPSAATSKR